MSTESFTRALGTGRGVSAAEQNRRARQELLAAARARQERATNADITAAVEAFNQRRGGHDCSYLSTVIACSNGTSSAPWEFVFLATSDTHELVAVSAPLHLADTILGYDSYAGSFRLETAPQHVSTIPGLPPRCMSLAQLAAMPERRQACENSGLVGPERLFEALIRLMDDRHLTMLAALGHAAGSAVVPVAQLLGCGEPLAAAKAYTQLKMWGLACDCDRPRWRRGSNKDGVRLTGDGIAALPHLQARPSAP